MVDEDEDEELDAGALLAAGELLPPPEEEDAELVLALEALALSCLAAALYESLR